MKDRDKWPIAKILLDEISGPYGYVLGGGLAFKAHGLTDRLVDDIDLFNPLNATDGHVAREKARKVLRRADYSVEIFELGDEGPSEKDGCVPHSGKLRLTDLSRPVSGENDVFIDMARKDMKEPSVMRHGMPVMSIRDCVESAVTALIYRRETKDFADVGRMKSVLGPELFNRYVSEMKWVDTGHFNEMLRGVRDISDSSFARCDLSPSQAEEVRETLSPKAEVRSTLPDPPSREHDRQRAEKESVAANFKSLFQHSKSKRSHNSPTGIADIAGLRSKGFHLSNTGRNTPSATPPPSHGPTTTPARGK